MARIHAPASGGRSASRTTRGASSARGGGSAPTPSVDPRAPLTETSVLQLQQTAGNRAVVQRVLIAPNDFTTHTSATALRRGKTLKEIDRLLALYHELRDTREKKTSGNKHAHMSEDWHNQWQETLSHLVQVTQFWITSHEGDTSRDKMRMPHIQSLHDGADSELGHAKSRRRKLKLAKFKPEGSKFVQEMEGNASTVLGKVGKVISAALPTAGDSCEVEVALKISVDPSASAYVGMRLKFAAERQDRGESDVPVAAGQAAPGAKKAEPDYTTLISLEAAGTGGFKAGGVVDVGFELGGNIEATGSTPEQAMDLISWGWYRSWRELKVVPHKMINFLWGGSSSTVGWKRAEKWASNVEKAAFGKDNSSAKVRTGIFGGAKAEGGVAGVAKVGGAFQLAGGKQYTKQSLAQKRKDKKLDAIEKPHSGASRTLGGEYFSASGAFSVAAGPVSGELSSSFIWTRAKRAEKYQLASIEAGISGTGTMPVNADTGSQIANYVKDFGPHVAKLIRSIALHAKDKDKSVGTNLATVFDLGDGVPGIMNQLQWPGAGGHIGFDAYNLEWLGADTPMKDVASQAGQGPQLDNPPTAALTLSVDLGWEFSEGEFKGFSAEVSLGITEEISGSVSLLAGRASKTRRLIRFAWEGGSWKPSAVS